MSWIAWVLQYPRAVLVVVTSAITAALAAYTRDQSREGILWLLRPITRRLPWNKRNAAEQRTLTSSLTIIDVQLVDASGALARYRKTSAYHTRIALQSYREGVTASGFASGFRSARGRIIRTIREHGFYMSEIDLGRRFEAGEEFINVYEALLRNSFQAATEEWTQQTSFETDNLIIQVHFPASRPPLRVRTVIIDGTDERNAEASAQVLELYGRKSLVWHIPSPSPAYVYKLSWAW